MLIELLRRQQHPWIRAALTRARKRPVFFFGVPFVGQPTVLGRLVMPADAMQQGR